MVRGILGGMNRRAWAWALYDWANSAFPAVVSTFVIAAYFTKGIAPDPATGQALTTVAGLRDRVAASAAAREQ